MSEKVMHRLVMIVYQWMKRKDLLQKNKERLGLLFSAKRIYQVEIISKVDQVKLVFTFHEIQSEMINQFLIILLVDELKEIVLFVIILLNIIH